MKSGLIFMYSAVNSREKRPQFLRNSPDISLNIEVHT
jgi:hypothetical protein